MSTHSREPLQHLWLSTGASSIYGWNYHNCCRSVVGPCWPFTTPLPGSSSEDTGCHEFEYAGEQVWASGALHSSRKAFVPDFLVLCDLSGNLLFLRFLVASDLFHGSSLVDAHLEASAEAGNSYLKVQQNLLSSPLYAWYVFALDQHCWATRQSASYSLYLT